VDTGGTPLVCPDEYVDQGRYGTHSQVNSVTGSNQARRHGFRAGGARKIWRALSLFFDDYGAL